MSKKPSIRSKKSKTGNWGLDSLTSPQIGLTLILELVVMYMFASLAIDSGSLWQYLITIVIFVAAAQSFTTLVRRTAKRYEKKPTKRPRRTA